MPSLTRFPLYSPKPIMPKFSEDSGFYSELQNQVRSYFLINGKSTYANRWYLLKIILLLSLYATVYSFILLSANSLVSVLLYGIFGVLAVLIGLNIGHDAAHGSLSKRPIINQLGLLAFDLVGANAYMWRNRHVYAHHPYPNVIHSDSDIQQTNFVRIFPADQLKSWQRFQHWYMPLLYLFYIPYWLFYRDIHDFRKKSIGAWKSKGHSAWQIARLLVSKGIFVGYSILVPLFLSPVPDLTILIGVMLMFICASLTVSIALISTHVGVHSEFPEPDVEGRLAHSWAEHQVITTTDFATKNIFLTQIFGGFNHHAVHHLFPHICHIHYPELTPILIRVAHKYGVNYTAEAKWQYAARSHWRLLKLRSRKEQLAEAVQA